MTKKKQIQAKLTKLNIELFKLDIPFEDIHRLRDLVAEIKELSH